MRKFKIHPSFFIVFIILILIGLIKELLLILACFTIHELGHFFFIKLFKRRIDSIDIYPFGGVLIFENKNDFIYKGLLISFGGVLFNFIFFLISKMLHFHTLSFINIIFIYINILPLYPLDGGNIFILLLSYFIPNKLAKKIVMVLSILFTVMIVIFCLSFFESFVSWMFISFIIVSSIKGIIYLNQEHEKLILIKYLSPNNNFKKYKTRFWTTNLVDSLFIERVLEFDFSSFSVSEKDVLDKYYKNKKRL